MENINFEQKLLQKKVEMEQCDHLFLKTQEGYWTGGFHSSDYEYTPCTVKCLKCGLTNYHINMDVILRDKYSKTLKKISPSKYYWYIVNDEVFRKQFGNINSQEHASKGTFNLISDEVLPVTNPILIFQKAKQINPDASNEGLFEIMKELYATQQDKNVKTRKK